MLCLLCLLGLLIFTLLWFACFLYLFYFLVLLGVVARFALPCLLALLYLASLHSFGFWFALLGNIRDASIWLVLIALDWLELTRIGLAWAGSVARMFSILKINNHTIYRKRQLRRWVVKLSMIFYENAPGYSDFEICLLTPQLR